MSLISIIAFAIIFLATVTVQLANYKKATTLLTFLSFIAIGTCLIGNFGGDNYLLLAIISLVSINFVLASMTQNSKIWLKYMFVAMSIAIFFILGHKGVLELNGENFVLLNKFSIAGIIVAGFSPLFVMLKGKALARLFGVNSEKTQDSITHFFIGVGLYFTIFGAGYVGIYLTLSFYLLSSFYHQNLRTTYPMLYGLLLIAYFHNIDVNLIQGDSIFGFFIGLFGLLFISNIELENKRHKILFIITLLFFSLSTIGILLAGNMHPAMGGLDALLFVIFGLAIGSLLKKKEEIGIGLLSLVFTIGLFYTIGNNLDEDAAIIDEKRVDSNYINPDNRETYLILNGIEGKFQLVEDSSRVDFFLGQNNETKGAFKKVNGMVTFNNKAELTEFNIELSLADFTTFNKYRDESLVGEEYFKADKFPKMFFNSSKVEQVDSTKYKLTGEFEMLGVKQQEVMTLHRVASATGICLVGNGLIDRTKYGMTPSITEGNKVTFNYKVLLNQK